MPDPLDCYLAQHDVATAHTMMRDTLLRFLAHHGIDPVKYHETLTRAWLLAVRHFMARAGTCESADAFLDASGALLDTKVMLTHYSRAVLFSEQARARFVPPDLEPIPEAV